MAASGKSGSVSLLPTAFGVSLALLVCATVLIVGLAARPTGGVKLPEGYHVVHVDEVNFGLRLTDTTIPAGKFLFVDTNRGSVAHEFVLFKTERRAQNLPLLADKTVDEDSKLLENVADSGSDLVPGETRFVTADLEPGHYVLVCNLPTHYQLGMRLDVTVEALA